MTLIDIKKDRLINSLFDFYNSFEIQEISINGEIKLNLLNFDSLLDFDAKIKDVEIRSINQGSINSESVINFEISSGIYMDFKYSQLNKIRIEGGQIWRFNKKELCRKENKINDLATEEEIDDYDFKSGFLTNQNIEIGELLNE
tara:strand:+ start:133 stop:564 length:432 start_codon:yes stop_codon:yes gene_type:complete